MRLRILIPTFNEAENIKHLLTQLINLKIEGVEIDILVIDDGSPDGTAELALSLRNQNVAVMERPFKTGLGPSYIAGITDTLQKNMYSHIMTMDADGSHQIVDLITLIDNAILYPNFLILGSRWIPGGEITNWPKWRQLISRTGTWYAKKMLKLKIFDLTGGFKIYPVSFLEKIELDDIVSNGYSFQIELTMASVLNGAKYVEIPINFVERTNGRSKMSFKIFIEAIVQVTRWGFALRMRNNADKLHYVN